MSKIKELEKRIEKLEKLLENSKRNRVVEISEWILAQFKGKDSIPVWKIMEMGKKKGYSTQMISRARRELLHDQIDAANGRGGWLWLKS